MTQFRQRGTYLAALLLVLSTDVVLAQQKAQYRGGSNIVNYQGPHCYPAYEAWNPITNFDVDSATVNGVLQSMRSRSDETNGYALSQQESIRVNVFHIRGGERCTGALGARGINLDSTGGSLAAQCFSNLQALVSSLAARGYKNIQIGIHPQGDNNPYTWPSDWDSNSYYLGLFSENWNFINEVRCAVRQGLGLACGGTNLHPTTNYRIDLFNEGSFWNDPQYVGEYKYTQYIWGNYFNGWGKQDTVGFSIAATDYGTLQNKVNAMQSIYTVNGVLQLPNVIEYHMDQQAHYTDLASLLLAKQYNMPWIIGETGYYNDSTVAQNLSNGYTSAKLQNPSHTVLYVLQWPSTRGDQSCMGQPAAIVPLNFSRYNQQGW